MNYSLLWDEFGSIFIDPNKILNLKPTNRTFLKVFTAPDTGSIVFTRHIDAILIILIANNTGVRMRPLTNKRRLNTTHISLTGPNFKNGFISQLKRVACLPLKRQSHPSSVGCRHVLDEVLVANWNDCWVSVW